MLSCEENELLTQTSAGTPMGNLMRRAWQPVALSEELPTDGAPLQVRVMGEELVLFRDFHGSPALLGLRCSHRGSDLSYGRIEERGLRCLYHGWLYDTAGNCLEQPGEPTGSDFCKKIRHPAYPCQELGGLIFAYLGPGAPPTLPHFEALVAADDHRLVEKYFTDCNYLQSIENHVDPSHVSFLHRFLSENEELDGYDAASGASRDGLNRPSRIVSLAAHVVPKIEVEVTDFGIRVFTTHDLGDKTYLRCNTFIAPNLAAVTAATAGDGYSIFWNVPIDDTQHFKYGVDFQRSRPIEVAPFRRRQLAKEMGPGHRLVRNRGNHHLQDREEMKTRTFSGFGPLILVQDTANMESQGVIQDRTQERLGYTDKAVIAMRQALLNAARRLEAGHEPRALAPGETPQPVVLAEFVADGEDLDSYIQRRVAEDSDAMTAYMLAAQGEPGR